MQSSELATVRHGITLWLASVLLMIASVLLVFLTPFIGWSAVLVSPACAVTGGMLGLIGSAWCLSAPRDTKAGLWIFGYVVCMIVSIVFAGCTLAVVLMHWFSAMAILSRFGWLWSAAFLLQGPLALEFVARIAIYLGRRDIVRIARRSMLIMLSVGAVVSIFPNSNAQPLLHFALGVIDLYAYLLLIRCLVYVRRAMNPVSDVGAEQKGSEMVGGEGITEALA